MRTFINDVPTAHLVMTDPKGLLHLQVHSVRNPEDAGKQVRFRNVKLQTQDLKPLPADDSFVANLMPTTLSDQETKNGYSLLWDGRTATGRRAPYGKEFPANIWEIKDGTLTVKPQPAGAKHSDIVTEKEFGAFDLQFEFKLTPGANSGVKYFVVEEEKLKGAVIGLEYQVLDDEKHPDAKQGAAGNRTQALCTSYSGNPEQSRETQSWRMEPGKDRGVS